MKNKEKFTKLAIKDIEFSEKIKSWTYKELGDYLIQEIWGDEKINKLGTLKCAVLDRVINELFILDEKHNSRLRQIKLVSSFFDNHINDTNKDIKVPKYDRVSKGIKS